MNNNFNEDFGIRSGGTGSSTCTAPDSATSSSSLPFAQINVKPQTRQKVLKLNPPAIALAATFSTLQPFCDSLHKSEMSERCDPILTNYATVGLIECFSSFNGNFFYDKSLNPRRVLTKPSRPVHNNGHDNEKWDYILYVNDVIGNEEGRKYVILDLLGQGTFGQVVKCINVKTRELCAVKVIKNQPAYFNQSMMEVTVLEMLNQKYDRDDRRHIVRMRDTFIFRQHLCIVVELLSLNLYDLIKQNGYRGFSLGLCRVFLAQTLDALTVLKEARIIHCDLKPENILLKSLEAPIIKVIDYGSACHEHQTVYTYIQSRFYRSPEIILGLPYTSSIDMWSVGCIAAELFLGLPIFPGCSNYDQISRIVECLGLPPHHMLEMGKDALTYFDKFPNQPPGRVFALKSRERYSQETGRSEPVPKKYFSTTTFPQIIMNYPMRSSKDISAPERDTEMANRRCFADFVGGLLNLNPLERWNPYHAMQHPFITGKPFTGPFQPTLLPLLTTPKSPTMPPTANAAPVESTTTSTHRTRPRSNTLSTLSFQDVPPQLQRLAAVSKSQANQMPPPASQRTVPDEAMTSYDGPALFDQRRNSRTGTTSATTPNTSSSSDYIGKIGNTANSNQYHNTNNINNNNQYTRNNPNNPQIQAHQRLSAYMTNRRVSNPAGMDPYIGTHNNNNYPKNGGNNVNMNYSMQPSSLPVSTGFFHYNNNNNNNNNNNTSSNGNNTNNNVIPPNSPTTLANMGRRNSRGSSQLSLETSVSNQSIASLTSSTSTASSQQQPRRGSIPSAGLNASNSSSSFGGIHRIDEDSSMSSPSPNEDEDEDIFQNFENEPSTCDESLQNGGVVFESTEEASKRQRKRT
jgi:serine/threonine protein kinase